MGKSVEWARRGLQSINRLALLCAIVIAVLAGLAYCSWLAPTWKEISTIEETGQRVSSQNEVVRTLAQIALGVLVLMGLLFTARRVVAAEQTAKAAQRTVEVAQEGQITERFTRAIEQLGNDNIAMRLGGIYALERIAFDSDKDRSQVMEVLTAYVREHSRIDRQSGGQSSDRPVTTDIQAILTVLGRLNTDIEEPIRRLDLHNTNLRGADFTRARLQWAILTNANLHGAILSGANLLGAILTTTNLQEADLSFANLTGVNFADADLQDATLFNCNLQYAHLGSASLLRTDITNTDLSDVIGLTQEQVDFAVADENTKLPNCLMGDHNP